MKNNASIVESTGLGVEAFKCCVCGFYFSIEHRLHGYWRPDQSGGKGCVDCAVGVLAEEFRALEGSR